MPSALRKPVEPSREYPGQPVWRVCQRFSGQLSRPRPLLAPPAAPCRRGKPNRRKPASGECRPWPVRSPSARRGGVSRRSELWLRTCRRAARCSARKSSTSSSRTGNGAGWCRCSPCGSGSRSGSSSSRPRRSSSSFSSRITPARRPWSATSCPAAGTARVFRRSRAPSAPSMSSRASRRGGPASAGGHDHPDRDQWRGRQRRDPGHA